MHGLVAEVHGDDAHVHHSQCSKSKKTNEKLFKNQRYIKKLPKELPLALGSADLGLLGIIG